jgi:hypothetical protein
MRPVVVALCLGLLSGCATRQPIPSAARFAGAESNLRAARSTHAPIAQRVGDYLAAAAATLPAAQGASTDAAAARAIYNMACAELTVLLRSADNGAFWNRTIQVAGRGGSFELSLAPAPRAGVWSPTEFTSFITAFDQSEKGVKTPNRRAGVGGTLVGVRNPNPRAPFSLDDGIAGAVTAVLEFRGTNATLVLFNPIRVSTTRLMGSSQPLAADFSAPLCYYRPGWSSWSGIEAGFFPGSLGSKTGLYLLQPYDPNRIPVIFIHGLISSPEIWIDVINNLQTDPVLRERYQALVFWYPTGDPASYTALLLRQAMAEFEKTHSMPHGWLIVSHSLGGLLAQMQTTTLTKEDWIRHEGDLARRFFARQTPGNLPMRAVTFTANSKVKRVVFIATPHIGAELAVSSLAEFAERIISIPSSVVVGVKRGAGEFFAVATGNPNVLPDGVTSLSPKNPLLLTMAATSKVVPPCHSIIGNRGLPGPLAESSDGIVPYWSSHLSYAKSEVIVPGPHSCYDYPGSVAELKRILHLQLKGSGE